MPVVPLWSAATPPGVPAWLQSALQWLLIFGEPSITIPDEYFQVMAQDTQVSSQARAVAGLLAYLPIGGMLTWVKVVGLFCLLGWAGSWLVTAVKERVIPRWLNVAALVGLVGSGLTVFLQVMQAEGRISPPTLGRVSLIDVLTWACQLALVGWVLAALWRAVLRSGDRYDVLTLIGTHLALALGMATAFGLQRMAPGEISTVVGGARIGATFMGFVVLARVVGLLAREVVAVRWRRLYSIGWHTVVESYRRMWAPWVVLSVFLVVLAFIHWFLAPPRPAELGRLYVGTLALLGSLLLTVMIVILAPITIPHDIQQQTIYTVVSKPVRRLELIWGRMLGFMALVTVLLLIFGGISLAYLDRTIGKSISATKLAAQTARKAGNPDRARVLDEQAEQLATRMGARVPVKGSLLFHDSRGEVRERGISVGSEMEFRSHIEGATQGLALWRFGVVRDPMNPNGLPVDRRIPVELLLRPGSIEDVENRLAMAIAAVVGVQQQQEAATKADEGRRLADRLVRLRERVAALEADRDRLAKAASDLEARASAEDARGRTAQAVALRREAARLHTPPIPLEMTFNIFRTTKGQVVGAPVHAEIKVRRLAPRSETPGEVLASRLLPIREYYTNRIEVPAKVLVGSLGHLAVEVRCIEPNQYLGMAESDLYILASRGRFETNYLKGLSGVWLQAMVLTAIGVWAGTFLSWPVALLMTIFFFVAGQVAFGFLQEFAMHSLVGGGPFESLVRLLTHENLMNKLQATPAVVTAKTFDALVTPVMARLVYVVPNFAGLDVSNTVADGFAVEGRLLWANLLAALAYALPFSVAGYFILKNREVAA